jgi:malate synthase
MISVETAVRRDAVLEEDENMAGLKGIELLSPPGGRGADLFTREALRFLADLHRKFNPSRNALLHRRTAVQGSLNRGAGFDFLPETTSIRDGSWKVERVPADLQDRRVEITGPTDRKMMINALNSGAQIFMADFEDANTPAWRNVFEGQLNLLDAVRRTISYTSADGKRYALNKKVATLLVRPRGWHLPEKHLRIDGEPASASLVDFGLYLFHNAKELLARGTGPYFYLPKMEGHQEAKLWDDVFSFAEQTIGIRRGTVKATVLIETIPAAFEMEEILYELREHAAGLNAGRWDYTFSIIKKFRTRPDFVLPDRAQVTMTVPFMRAYTDLLVKTCHRRGAHAIGGMAAFVPSRKDPQVNEVALAKVREDKVREANGGFDGTWVAHPDLVPIAVAVFDGILKSRPNQLGRLREEVHVTAKELLDIRVPGGTITEAGLRNDVAVGIQYLAAWLTGTGAVAILNLMEDTATAEIARSQVWQWIHHGAHLQEGPAITRELVHRVENEELAKVRTAIGPDAYSTGKFEEARDLFEAVALDESFVEFLTIPAYDRIN